MPGEEGELNKEITEMKISNDYEIRVEQKYYAIFKDINGIEQKVEVEKEVAEALIQAHRSEKANARYNERHSYSLDSLSYEGEAFASYDDYMFEKELTHKEKVKAVLESMKPKQAKLLFSIFFLNKTQQEIAKEENVSQAAISQRFSVSKENFQKMYKKLFSKTL